MGCLLAALSTATAQSIFSAVNPAPSKVLGSSSTNIASKSGVGSSSTGSHVNCSRDDEWDSCAVSIVESAIEIYKTVLEFIQRSPRGERIYYDNLLYLGAWLLLSGLQAQLTHTSQVSIN
jgi:E3 ubiquitin-protein ligases UBR4 N-terminal